MWGVEGSGPGTYNPCWEDSFLLPTFSVMLELLGTCRIESEF